MIEVRIDTSIEAMRGHDVLAGAHIANELRKAGVPVIGRINVAGIEHGTLSYSRDGDIHVYRWTPGADTPQTDNLDLFA